MPQRVSVSSNRVKVVATGPRGPIGPRGPAGEAGVAGPAGNGVPTGGSTNEILRKTSGADGATEWAEPTPEMVGADPEGTAAELVRTADVDGSIGLRPGGLAAFRAAYDNVLTTPINIVAIGDSTTGSHLTGSVATDLWLNRLQALLARPVPQPIAIGSRYTGGNSDAPNVTTTSGTDTNLTSGGWGKDLAVGNTVTLVGVMDRVGIEYRLRSGGGSLVVRDGGPGGTIIGTIPTAGTAKAGQVWVSGPLTGGLISHTIHVEATGAACYLGIVNGMAGNIHTWNTAHGGLTSVPYTSTPSYALNLIEELDPDLTIIATGTNDDAGNYSSRITALIQAVKAVTTGSVALLIPPIAAGFGGGTFTKEEAELGRAVAVAEDVAVIDLARTLGEYSTNGLQLSEDGLHQTPRGHKAWAAAASAVLIGDPIGETLRSALAAPVLGKTSADAAPGNVLVAERGDMVTLEDDFMVGDPAVSGSIGLLRWTKVGVGTTANPGSTVRPGILQIISGAAGDFTSINLPGAASPVIGDFALTFWIQQKNTNALMRLGLGTVTAAGAANGLFFEHEVAGTWAVTGYFLGAEISRVATPTVTSAVDAWHKFSLVNTGTTDAFYWNDTLIYYQTAGAGTQPPCVAVGSPSVANRGIVVDRVQLSLSKMVR